MSSVLFASIGAAISLVFTGAGSTYAMVQGSRITLRQATRRSAFREFVSFVPVIVGGVLSIYGLIVCVLISRRIDGSMSLDDGYQLFGAGLCMGGTGLFSGLAMGKLCSVASTQATEEKRVEDESEGSENQTLLTVDTFRERNPRKFICVLVFLEAVGLYGLIASLVLISNVPK